MTRNLAWMAAVALSASLLMSQQEITAQQTDAATDDAAAAEDDAAANQAAEDQTADDQSADDQPADDQPAESQPADSQPADAAPPAPGSESPPDSAETVPPRPQSDESPTADQLPAPRESEQLQSQQQSPSQLDQTDVDAEARVDLQADSQRGLEFGQANAQGLTITNVERNSVFFTSGIRQNDVIVSVAGRPIRSDVEFFQAFRPGESVPVVVLRDGRRQTILIESPHVAQTQQRPLQTGGPGFLGVVFDSRSPGAAIVREVNPGSPAEQAGLQRGDAIVELNGQPVRSPYDAIAIVRSMRAGDSLSISFERRLQSETEAVLAGRPSEQVRTAVREPDAIIVPEGPPIDRDIEVEVYDDDRRWLRNRAERRALRRDMRR